MIKGRGSGGNRATFNFKGRKKRVWGHINPGSAKSQAKLYLCVSSGRKGKKGGGRRELQKMEEGNDAY